jgi:hypothetical protein
MYVYIYILIYIIFEIVFYFNRILRYVLPVNVLAHAQVDNNFFIQAVPIVQHDSDIFISAFPFANREVPEFLVVLRLFVMF